MNRQKYDTDLTDAEWDIFEKTMLDSRKSKRGRKPTPLQREIVNAILYRLRTGCQWRNLPHDFPAWSTVHKTFRRWILNGQWKMVHDALCREVRKKTGATRNLAP